MEEKITRKDLEKAVREILTTTQEEAKLAVDTLFEELRHALADGKTVDLFGFGKFEVVERAARTGFNPAKQQKIEIPATKAIRFKASKSLKNKIR